MALTSHINFISSYNRQISSAVIHTVYYIQHTIRDTYQCLDAKHGQHWQHLKITWKCG